MAKRLDFDAKVHLEKKPAKKYPTSVKKMVMSAKEAKVKTGEVK
jgi:hypothetical protein